MFYKKNMPMLHDLTVPLKIGLISHSNKIIRYVTVRGNDSTELWQCQFRGMSLVHCHSVEDFQNFFAGNLAL
jgi:hypothetical protein